MTPNSITILDTISVSASLLVLVCAAPDPVLEPPFVIGPVLPPLEVDVDVGAAGLVVSPEAVMPARAV